MMHGGSYICTPKEERPISFHSKLVVVVVGFGIFG